jgi:glycosyltransferase involved in cell wall biosynthesis
LRAAGQLQDYSNIRFLIVGDGKERPNLQQMAQEMKLSNVFFTGSRPKAEMAEILAASDTCLAILMNIPMFSTTYPNKVFDYMAAGRPTILAIDGVIRQVVEASRGGVFVPPGDDRALADAVRKLADHPDRAREMGLAARDYVTRYFNRTQQAHEFIRLLGRLAAARQ